MITIRRAHSDSSDVEARAEVLIERKADCWDNAVAESFFATLRAAIAA